MSTTLKTTRRTVPSREEIRRAAAKIRQSWTPEMRATRRRIARFSQQALLFNCSREAA